MQFRALALLLLPAALTFSGQADASVSVTCSTVSGQVWCNYHPLPTGASRALSISAGHNASVWIITDQTAGPSDPNNNLIYYLGTTDWVQVPGAARTVRVSSDGFVWVLRNDGSIWQFNGTGFYQPTGMTGRCASSIGAGSNTNVYITDCAPGNCFSGECIVSHYNGSTWSSTGASAWRVGPPASSKAAWLTTGTGCISYYDGSSWHGTGCTTGNSETSDTDLGYHNGGANFFNSNNNHWYVWNSTTSTWTDGGVMAVTVSDMSSMSSQWFIDTVAGGVWCRYGNC